MTGIVSYGTYVPVARLERAAIAAALGVPAGKGTRSVASYDEDSTTLAVEAARVALAAAPAGWEPEALVLATATPAYQDKTNATTVHAALRMPRSVGAYDFAGAARSASGALRFAAASSARTLVLMSDIRGGLPGSAEEAAGGDGAVAICVGGHEPLAEVVAQASSSEEFLDRWRAPGDPASRVWEERFGEAAYLPLARAAIDEAMERAGLGANDIDHLIVTGLHARAVRSVAGRAGAPPAATAPDLTQAIGNTGTAHPGIQLADVLDRADPAQTVLLVHLADGADVMVLRTTDALAGHRQRRRTTVAEQIAAGRAGVSYATFLTWRGRLDREPPRRPEPDAPAAPPSWRNESWKFALVGSRCEVCDTRQLPPQRVCLSCHSVDRMSELRFADVGGTIANYTIDRLAFSPSPPMVSAVIDFDGGGRVQSELTDVDPAQVDIGTRVEMCFRRLYVASNGASNYFWKARPAGGRS
jgi:3-hydroxy-3-methylglutaryl CoA synthase